MWWLNPANETIGHVETHLSTTFCGQVHDEVVDEQAPLPNLHVALLPMAS